MKTGIYKILNSVDGKFYIGSSNNIEKRWKEHLNLLSKGEHYNVLMQRAWNKYGKDNFVLEVVELVEDRERLFQVEQHYLNMTKCYDKNVGYNLCPKAGSRRRATNSPEHRRKISKALTGKRLSLEHRRKISENQKGRKLSENHKKNISDSMSGYKQSPEHVEKARRTKLGSKNPAAILTEDDVREIRRRYESEDITQTALAREFGIRANLVCRIINRTRWAHVK